MSEARRKIYHCNVSFEPEDRRAHKQGEMIPTHTNLRLFSFLKQGFWSAGGHTGKEQTYYNPESGEISLSGFEVTEGGYTNFSPDQQNVAIEPNKLSQAVAEFLRATGGEKVSGLFVQTRHLTRHNGYEIAILQQAKDAIQNPEYKVVPV